MPKLIDLTGRKFGRLVVIKQVGKDKWGSYKWLCLCDCGNKTIIISYSLIKNKTKSCGCLQKQIVSSINMTHGHSRRGKLSKTYTVWASMIQRCTNPNSQDYYLYGERGIKVGKKWIKFSNFLEDMGEVRKGCQIDRINNNKNYCKSNCRWTTPKINSRNRRNNRLETYNGKTQCLAAWAEEYNIPYLRLWKRCQKYGWPIGKALTTPVNKRRKVR